MCAEQPFQNALMVALSRTGRVHIQRQPAGTIPVKRGGMVRAAPEGAADLTGGVTEKGPCFGVRLEIECKGPRTRQTAQQWHWGEFCRESGFIYLLVRSRASETAEQAAERACAEVMAAIDAAIARRRASA